MCIRDRAVLVFTAPGIPMIFQGQEFVRTDWFDDTKPIDWDEAGKREPTMRMYRDLIGLRLNKNGTTAGLSGSDIYPLQLNDQDKVIAFERCRNGAIGGKTIVVLNFGNRDWTDYRLGFPEEGTWKVRLNSASICHHFDEKFAVDSVQTEPQEHDGSQQSAKFPLAAYSAIIFSQD